jgi:hypothetical protein
MLGSLPLQKSPDAEMARCWKYRQTLKKPDAEKSCQALKKQVSAAVGPLVGMLAGGWF